MQYIDPLKTATLPPLRVESDFRPEIEGVLKEGEFLSSFVESSVRHAVQYRKTQAEFIAGGLASLTRVEAGAPTHSTEAVLAHLQEKLRHALASKGVRNSDV